mgnify:CR=1 FL=1
MRHCAILFDLFGTITDLESDHQAHEIISRKLSEIHDKAFEPIEHLKLYDELVHSSREPPLTSKEAVWQALIMLSKTKNFKIRVNRDYVYRLHREIHIEVSKLYNDVLSSLNKARSLCRYIVLVTDADRDVTEEMLKKHGIYEYFDRIIIGEEYGTRKPDAKLFIKAIEGLDVDKNLCFMIGDSWKDVEGAKNAGLRAVLILRRKDILEKLKVKPDYIASSLSDALNFIEKYLTNAMC